MSINFQRAEAVRHHSLDLVDYLADFYRRGRQTVRPNCCIAREARLLPAMSSHRLGVPREYVMSFFEQHHQVTDIIEGFQTWYRISESISAVGLVICIFLLLS